MSLKDISLTEQQIDQACEHILDLRPLDQLHKKLGFKSKGSFTRWLKLNPAIAERINEARLDSCRYLEDELLWACDHHDPKAARVKVESIKSLLAYLNPQKYSTKIDMNVNQTVSLRANIEAANERVARLVTEINPVLVTGK